MSLTYRSYNKTLMSAHRNLIIEVETRMKLKDKKIISRMDHLFNQVVINVISKKSTYEFRYNPINRQLVANSNIAVDSRKQPLRFTSATSVASYIEYFVNKEENPYEIED